MIADLVVNHTTIQHQWFRSGPAEQDAPFHDFYVWRSDEPPDTRDQVVFPDAENSIREFNEPTGEWYLEWYLHHFYKEQPDLDVTNPLVRDEVAKVMGFWLQMGLSGFRMDAVPFFLDTVGGDQKDFPDPHEFMRALRAFRGRRVHGEVILGEVNLPHAEQAVFFGGPEGESCPCSSTSSPGRRCTCRWPARTPDRWPRRSSTGPRSRRTTSGRRSCATTTS